MATLALNVVGTALGGPIGGAIGSLIGQGIDRSLFGPGTRQGPRLNDLKVQVSSYGSQIPRVYGTMRVAGTVVWATELQEASEVVGDTVVYTYSVSFAVALSSRAAKGIGRIWADGKLLRGAAGDFKVKTEFRFYSGDEDQPDDPLIASIEGPASTPAYRGLALAVFENLQLSEFGGRIPTLTFELRADEDPPSLGEILSDASDGIIACAATKPIGGYAAYGTSRKAAVAPLLEQFAVPLCDDGVLLVTPGDDTVATGLDEMGCGARDAAAAVRDVHHVPAGDLPRSLAVGYYDASRDYEVSQMRAASGSAGGVDEAIELPAVLGADQAKALAETSIARRWAERDRLVLRLSPDRLAVSPGQTVTLEDGSIWRVDTAAIEELVVRLELSRVSGSLTTVPADAGRHVPAADLVAQPTVIAVLDLPDLGIGRHDVPTLQVAACQVGSRWRPVPIEVASGGDVRTIASASAEAVIGVTMSALGEGLSVDVELADPDHWLESRDAAALADGANLAAIGNELMQFLSAVPIGPQRFRLSGLTRGCRGTEFAMGSHASGDTFVLIQPGMLQVVEFLPTALGSMISVKAQGLADDEASPFARLVGGEAMKPPSPINLAGQVLPDGTLSLAWARRSRSGWFTPEGVEPPLGESAERYRVIVQGSGRTLSFDPTQPDLLVPADQIAGMTGSAIIEVVQIGDFAQSRSARLSIEL